MIFISGFGNIVSGTLVSEDEEIGDGLIPLFLFGVSETPVWILPKVSVSLAKDFYIAAGAMLGGMVGSDSEVAGRYVVPGKDMRNVPACFQGKSAIPEYQIGFNIFLYYIKD